MNVSFDSRAFAARSNSLTIANAAIAASKAAKASEAKRFNWLLITASLCSAVVAVVLF